MPQRTNSKLHIPEPPARPGDPVDFSGLKIPEAGAVRRPEPDAAEVDLRDLLTR